MINSKKVVAVVAARMGSSRLPGKALLLLCGKPVLAHIVERLKGSRYIDEIIIATTHKKEDDAIENFCKERGFSVFRRKFEESGNDVLALVHDAAHSCGADIVYRGMGDTPLVDHRIVDRLIDVLEEGTYDFVSNELQEPAYPVGFDASVFPFSALHDAHVQATDPKDREHVTLFLYRQPEKYRIFSLTVPDNLSLPGLRVTLDTKEDYELIGKIYDALYQGHNDFSAEDVVIFMRKHPALLDINRHVVQKTLSLS